LGLLWSPIYSGVLAPSHLADLRQSGLSDETIRLHRIRSVPPAMIGSLLGFDVAHIRSAMLIPFPDPRTGGFMRHARVKIFPGLRDRGRHRVKYLQPRGSGSRLFFTLRTPPDVLEGSVPLWLVEGEKKALAVAQLGLPAVGFCGIEGWHVARSRALLADFDAIRLAGRIIELAPDGDWRVNPDVERGVRQLADALERRGARVRLVVLPLGVAA
jgi:uncharacterized protein DUF3854